MPRSRQARMTRTAISPRLATRTLRKGGVRSGLAGRPLRRTRMRVVPAAVVAVDPLGVGLEARAQPLVERALFLRARVADVRLAPREVRDEPRPALFLLLPEDLRPEVSDRAIAVAVAP